MSTPDNSEADPKQASESTPEDESNPGTEEAMVAGTNSESLPEDITIASLDDDARPHQFSPIHKVNGDDSEPIQIALCDLHENDYDPRGSLDRTEVSARADAIDQDHGHVHLIVRPIKGTVEMSRTTQFEVIKGRRDLAALRKLHGEDSEWLVDCTVRDVNDQTAMKLLLEAHEWQVGFSEVEQAHVYAKLLSVTYGGSEQSLEAYLEEARSAKTGIKLPSNLHSEVKALGEDLRPGPSTIARRLRLLLLPDQAQELVSAGDLSLRVAEIIVDGLRDLSDPVARREHMLELATSDHDDSTKDELRDRINTIQQSQDSPDQPEITEERIEELEQVAKQQEENLKTEVGTTINFYNGHDLTGTLDQSGLNQPLEKAESVIDACETRAEQLEPERIDPLIEEKGRLQTTRTRTETNLIEREEEEYQPTDANCLYCGCEVRNSDLKTRQKHLDQEIQEVSEQITTLRNERKRFVKKAHKIEDLRDQLTSASSELERARTKRSESASTETDPDTDSDSDPERGQNADSPTSS